MSKFSKYINDLKTQTDELRNVVSEKSGKECSSMSISAIATVVRSLKVDISDGDSITVPIPEELSTSSTIYTFRYDNDKILLSGNNAYGIWVYSNTTGTTVKRYSSNHSWAIFQKFGNECLISTKTSMSSSAALLSFDGENFKELRTYMYNCTIMKVVGDKCLIAGQGVYGVKVYDGNTLQDLVGNSTYWVVSDPIDGKCLLGNSDTSAKLYVYDGENVTELYEGGWANFNVYKDKWMIASSHYERVGTLVCDGTTVEKILDIKLHYFITYNDECIMSSDDSSNSGVWVYDGTTCKQLSGDGIRWIYSYKLGNKLMLVSSYTSGILIYDGESINMLYSQGSSWRPLINIGDKWLISSTAQYSSFGLLLFTGTAIGQIYSGSYDWQFTTINDNGKYEFESPNSKLIVEYDPLFDTAKATKMKVV